MVGEPEVAFEPNEVDWSVFHTGKCNQMPLKWFIRMLLTLFTTEAFFCHAK
jgi:hypothetical protein